MEPRQGNPEPRYGDLPNGSINSSGLPNQGFKYYLDWAFNKREEEETLRASFRDEHGRDRQESSACVGDTHTIISFNIHSSVTWI